MFTRWLLGGVAWRDLSPHFGLRPRIKASSNNNGTWYTTWRESVAPTGSTMPFVYCDLAPASGEMVVSSTKRPYLFDAWTGRQAGRQAKAGSNVPARQLNHTAIPLSMAGNQTFNIAFFNRLASDIPTPSTHTSSRHPRSVIGADFNETSGISMHVVGPAMPGNVSTSPTERPFLIGRSSPGCSTLGSRRCPRIWSRIWEYQCRALVESGLIGEVKLVPFLVNRDRLGL